MNIEVCHFSSLYSPLMPAVLLFSPTSLQRAIFISLYSSQILTSHCLAESSVEVEPVFWAAVTLFGRMGPAPSLWTARP